MNLQLATANENGRRSASNRRGGPVWPPEVWAPTQGRPYGLPAELEFS